MSKAGIPDLYQGYRVVTAVEMAELDRRATDQFGVPALLLMENAGKAVAAETVRFLKERGGDPSKALVTVCCGRGNNGGDGLVAGRHLKRMGAEVVAYLAPPRRDGTYGTEVADNLKRAVSAGVSVQEMGSESVGLDVRLRSSDVVIDALLGTGFSGKPSGVVHEMIQRMMKSGKPIIAIDLPSGINPDTGYHSGVFVNAALTLTLGLPKRGLLASHAQKHVGELKVVDIGFPKQLVGTGA